MGLQLGLPGHGWHLMDLNVPCFNTYVHKNLLICLHES